MKIVFCTAVYPQAWKWHEEFVQAINKQNYKEFDVMIANDGLSDEEMQELKCKINNDILVINVSDGCTISEIRKRLLKEAKKKYDLAIFGDFDDVFANNRIKRYKEAFNSEYTFYYNELILHTGEKVFKQIPSKVLGISPILEQNFIGLSNSAVNLKKISENFIENLNNVRTNVFDWYLYSEIVLQGGKGVLVRDTYTEYRQSDTNIIGIYEKNIKNIKREIVVKKEQYRLLKDKSIEFQKLYQAYSKLDYNESNMENLNNEFVGYWWSILKIFKEEKNV